MSFLKQSTAVTVRFGPFLDKTDGVSEETGLTPGIEVSKNHGAFGARSSASAVSHDTEGWYAVPLDTTDTGTLGKLILKAHDSANHLPVWMEFVVVPANVYDAIVAGSDYLQTDAVQIEGVDATNQINAEADTALADYDPPTKAELDSGLAALNDLDAAGIRTAIGLAAANLDTQLAAIDDAVDTEVAAIKAKTDNLPASPAATGDSMALTAAAVDAVLDEVVEGTVTMRQLLRVLLAFAAGKTTGGATTSIAFRDQADTKNRIAMTVDTDGDRSATTVDGS